ncbi:MAG TPA: hypothetical protein ENJ62_01875 [Bryobacterales bacterium]|nr:hypothetical protein [Bryobacterales bacterium]
MMFHRGIAAVPFAAALLFAAWQARDGALKVSIIDVAAGRPTPARVRLLDEDGKRPAAVPDGAVGVLWGRNDRAEGFSFASGDAFYADGSFSARLHSGRWRLRVSKGFEYLPVSETLDVTPGSSLEREIRLERWIDMPARGWYSSDDHIHVQRSPRDDPAILRWIAGEDIHVGNILEMGDFWATYFTQYAFGPEGRYREDGRILSPGQEEPRTPEIGHTISLGAAQLVRFRDDYYNYARYFDRVHALGGISGFAHQAVSFHGYRGMVLTALAGKVDFLELAQFCVDEGPLATRFYYQFLDLGIPLTALAGSDYPWCGRGKRYGLDENWAQIGNARFYTYVGGDLTFDKWFAAVKAGRTFATTGPMLEFTVNGKLPGERIDVKPNARLRIRAAAFGQSEHVPLERLEIVVHGNVVAHADGSREKLEIDLELPVDHGVWIAARAKAGPGQSAHTTPVYVTVDGGGFENPETFSRNLRMAGEYLEELEQELASPREGLNRQASRHEARLRELIAAARRRLDAMAAKR